MSSVHWYYFYKHRHIDYENENLESKNHPNSTEELPNVVQSFAINFITISQHVFVSATLAIKPYIALYPLWRRLPRIMKSDQQIPNCCLSDCSSVTACCQYSFSGECPFRYWRKPTPQKNFGQVPPIPRLPAVANMVSNRFRCISNLFF